MAPNAFALAAAVVAGTNNTSIRRNAAANGNQADSSTASSSSGSSTSSTSQSKSCPIQKYLINCKSIYSCIYCLTHLANHDELVSRSFQGNHGRAYLFNSVVNISCGPAVQRELNTGSHAVADIFCENCQTILGWKYEKAFVETQKYKEGKYIIELAHVVRENKHLELDKGHNILNRTLANKNCSNSHKQPKLYSYQQSSQPHSNTTSSFTNIIPSTSTSCGSSLMCSPTTTTTTTTSSSSSSSSFSSSNRPIQRNSNKISYDNIQNDEDDDELMFVFYDDFGSNNSSHSNSLSSSQHNKIRRSLYLDSTPYDWKYFATTTTPPPETTTATTHKPTTSSSASNGSHKETSPTSDNKNNNNHQSSITKTTYPPPSIPCSSQSPSPSSTSSCSSNGAKAEQSYQQSEDSIHISGADKDILAYEQQQEFDEYDYGGCCNRANTEKALTREKEQKLQPPSPSNGNHRCGEDDIQFKFEADKQDATTAPIGANEPLGQKEDNYKDSRDEEKHHHQINKPSLPTAKQCDQQQQLQSGIINLSSASSAFPGSSDSGAMINCNNNNITLTREHCKSNSKSSSENKFNVIDDVHNVDHEDNDLNSPFEETSDTSTSSLTAGVITTSNDTTYQRSTEVSRGSGFPLSGAHSISLDDEEFYDCYTDHDITQCS